MEWSQSIDLCTIVYNSIQLLTVDRHWSYKVTSAVKLPIEDGIEPLNWLLYRYLFHEISDNWTSVTIDIQISQFVQISNFWRNRSSQLIAAHITIQQWENAVIWYSHSYKYVSAVKLPIDDGIEPVNWFVYNCLQQYSVEYNEYALIIQFYDCSQVTNRRWYGTTQLINVQIST